MHTLSSEQEVTLPDIVKFKRKKLNQQNIKRAITFLKSLPQDIAFKSLNPTQHCFECLNWQKNDFNIKIKDFVKTISQTVGTSISLS